jgi:hypothetical protein
MFSIISRFLPLILLLSLFAYCQTCRVTSIEDAHRWQSQGYETRIAVYKTGVDGLIAGAFLWTHHAQAQVKVNNEWKWVDGGIEKGPRFTVDGEIILWRVTDYEAYLKQQGRYN